MDAPDPAPLDPAPSAAPADAALSVRDLSPRGPGGGSWASGTVGGFSYEALVFPAHAADPALELGTSRISKLWLRGAAGNRSAARFDRGWDQPPATPEARAAVELLAARLATRVFGD